jgi:hypothetical protein
MPSVIRGGDGFDSDIHQGIGVNQTWQDVLSQRASGVTYTNTTGKPIVVFAGAFYASDGTTRRIQARAWVDNTLCANHGSLSTYPEGGVSFVVPNGSSYLVTVGYGMLNRWTELR